MSNENVFSLVMCHVPVSQDDEFILEGLKKRYSDVVRVERIYGEEDPDVITTRVQVDFLWGEEVQTVLQDRQMIFNGGARRIYPLSPVPRRVWRKPVVENRPTAPPATLATEEDIRNLLHKDEQKLLSLFHVFDARLEKLVSS